MTTESSPGEPEPRNEQVSHDPALPPPVSHSPKPLRRCLDKWLDKLCSRAGKDIAMVIIVVAVIAIIYGIALVLERAQGPEPPP